MKFDPIKGRLGKHRFHPMLVHFPTALYLFSFCMDAISFASGQSVFSYCAFLALMGGVAMGALAMVYGLMDFIRIDTVSPGWRTAGIHGIIQSTVWIVFAILTVYRYKYADFQPGGVYLLIAGTGSSGVIVGNYLGAELLVRHNIGIEDTNVNSRT